ncbi:hypothetical protein G7047_11515 [Diaphorobacter sp. HDW4A]|uniref:hypothetical protein n=1 Tax=Diaphorobacter sp. HDW4A TaxID=2714924 RepID=UPI0014097D4A|nr:hypothetical protein [Diaphorobacter sp. HDW4A]QIL80459.1 hypothetical protein G7047_11515 [Diaphorobacter sp. HDW4A]
MRTSRVIWIFLLVASHQLPGTAAQLQIGGGSSVDFGDAVVHLGCSDLQVNGTASGGTAQIHAVDNATIAAGGTFNAGGAQIDTAGNFESTGTFNPGASTVSMIDGCGRTQSHVSGATSFHNLSVTTSTGKQLMLDAAKTVTVAGQLQLRGASGNLLKIRSTTAGTPSMISATTLQDIHFVDVADNRATGAVIAPGKASVFESVPGANIFRWFYFDENGVYSDPTTKLVPVFSEWTLVLLGLMLACVGMRYASSKKKSNSVDNSN